MYRMLWANSFIILFLSQTCLTSPEVSYQQMGFGSFCPDTQSVITSIHECRSAARSLFDGLQEQVKEVDDKDGFPGCAYAKEKDAGGVEWMARTGVVFNKNTNARSPRNRNNFAALCSMGNNKVLPDSKLDRNCVEKNTNTQSRTKIGDSITRTFNQCKEKCSATHGCLYWTWHTKLATGYVNKCVLMKDFGNKATDKTTISGTPESKDCEAIHGEQNRPIVKTTPKPQDCIEKNTNYTTRRTQIGSPTIASGWEQCEDKCSATKGCAFWTWATKTAPKTALKCILLSGGTRQNRVEVPIKMKDRNAISGKKGAIDCKGKSAATTCDASSWPDLYNDMVCGDCKGLVDKMNSKYKTCNNFCKTIDLGCSGAWEESNEDCIAKSTKTCAHEFTYETKAICECTAGVSVTTMFVVLYSIVAFLLVLAVCVYNLHSLVKRRKSA